MRALLGSVVLGLMVRGWFTRVRVLADGQIAFGDIPAVIPNLADRNLFLLQQAVALAGARVIAGSHEHQRWVARSVQGKEVT
ncbi:hypothetical protein HaLaN_04416 [Haematococcus lacustris]|uniref:Uncharacterized protein n=1 Tax=Haematococcus lacustris TaxID=44745 RepID=A0A699YQX7_HAELA|nr:hypothetical protein HaLaN_04416 [Haematococcus lacustris]